MIKKILWDIDGTLLDFSKAERYAIKKCFEIFNIGVCTDEMVDRYSPINKKYWEMLERGEITKQEVLTNRFKEFFQSENIEFNKIDEFNQEYQIRLGDKAFFCDGGYETVKALRGTVEQYAVTNGTLTAQSKKLKTSGLGELFDDVFISDVIGYEKPSIEFFKAVENKIGTFNRAEVMIVGDSLTSDMRGGNNADIQTCWYNPNHTANSFDISIDYVIENLNEVIKIINK